MASNPFAFFQTMSSAYPKFSGGKNQNQSDSYPPPPQTTHPPLYGQPPSFSHPQAPVQPLVPIGAPIQNHATYTDGWNHPPSAPPATVPITIPGNKYPPVTSRHGKRSGLSTSLPTKDVGLGNYTFDACEFCFTRPKYREGNTIHPYCGKTCANKDKLRNQANSVGSLPSQSHIPVTGNSNSNGSSGNCEYCYKWPKHHDGVKLHPYCSKACAKLASTGNGSNTTNGSQNHGRNASASNGNSLPRNARSGSMSLQRTTTMTGGVGAGVGTSMEASGVVLCNLPDCDRDVYISSDGKLGEYCSKKHESLAESGCIMCFKAPKMKTSHFCSQDCVYESEKNGPMIMEVPSSHVTYQSVEGQFKASWRHGSQCPPVRKVYKICLTPALVASYEAYKSMVEARGQFTSIGRSPGNENRRWHGTRRDCPLGEEGHTQLCSSQSCSLCCIIRNSFDVNFFQKKTGWGRFGRGIYTSSTSSKSNDYTNNSPSSSLKHRAMLLNRVVVGQGYKLMHNNSSLTSAPPGYDSILAEKGGSLNYDELVVYNNDAIRPSFLVLYEW